MRGTEGVLTNLKNYIKIYQSFFFFSDRIYQSFLSRVLNKNKLISLKKQNEDVKKTKRAVTIYVKI